MEEDFQVLEFPDGLRLNSMAYEDYLFRLGFAQGLAARDWGDDPDRKLWENRYINLITGLSSGPMRLFESLPKEKRIKMIEKMLETGAPLDAKNDPLGTMAEYEKAGN